MQESTHSTGRQGHIPRLRRLSIAIAASIFWLWCSSVTLAERKKPQPEGFFNPLEITAPDPLLPRPALDQSLPLSLPERLKLATALDNLNQQATAKLELGDRTGAFEIWNRELRLRRSLGFLEEVRALGRVGAVAWKENQSAEVQVITRRLQAIQQQTSSQPVVELDLLRSLGTAFEQVRSPKSAIEVYEQVLSAARQRQDKVEVEATLKTIGELHLSWFDYAEAAAIYKELIELAKADPVAEMTYLQQLAYIYDQAKMYQQAVDTKQQLADFYLNEDNFTQLPALRLEIAADYESLDQVEAAFRNYQEAYASAWTLQQYARAGDALRKLVALYQSQGQLNEALTTSQTLLQAEQLASNVYGLMETYDQIGQIYIDRGNHPEALAAFQKGLVLAQELKYRERYFTRRIEQLQQISK